MELKELGSVPALSLVPHMTLDELFNTRRCDDKLSDVSDVTPFIRRAHWLSTTLGVTASQDSTSLYAVKLKKHEVPNRTVSSRPRLNHPGLGVHTETRLLRKCLGRIPGPGPTPTAERRVFLQ